MPVVLIVAEPVDVAEIVVQGAAPGVKGVEIRRTPPVTVDPNVADVFHRRHGSHPEGL